MIVAASSIVSSAQVKTRSGSAAVYESIAYGVRLSEPVPTDGLSNDVRHAFLQFSSRAKRFTTRIPEPTGSELREVWGERTGIERVVFSLFDTPDVSREAESFVQSLPFYYEAEGNIWTVLAVPDAADDYLKAHPQSVIRDYVRLLAGHRRSCAISGSEFSSTTDDTPQLRQARADLNVAAQSRHSLIRFVAQRELTVGCAR